MRLEALEYQARDLVQLCLLGRCERTDREVVSRETCDHLVHGPWAVSRHGLPLLFPLRRKTKHARRQVAEAVEEWITHRGASNDLPSGIVRLCMPPNPLDTPC